jgi:hypothetical protein
MMVQHMKRILPGTIVLGVTVIAGCAFATRPVPFEASPAAWEALAGEWRGDYTMDGHDRHGIIAFDLKSAEHLAEGDVLMIPDRSAWPYRARGGGSVDSTDRTPPRDVSQLLSIHFVMAEGGQIRGSMEPYWDPDRSCQASATFIGSVDGNTIAGTFASVCEDGVRTLRGRWKVERRPHTR